MKNVLASILGVLLIIALIGISIFFGATPTGKAMWNNWFHTVQKVDDATNYKTKKKVEDAE